MAPANNDRHPNHTGTIPKTKVRNNCNVPQEAVTPTRRDMTTNLVSTSLDWVPVSEYNSRSNYNQQSRKQTNNTSTSDQELNDLDNSVTFESGFGRFVPVRPQPRVLPLNVQNRDNLTTDNHDDAGSSVSGHTLHPYAHQMQNGLIAHTNHAAAAIMIVNPTTPNAVTGNISQPFNAPNQNRNNLTRNLNSSRNNIDSHASNNNSTPPSTSQRSKTVNLMNNMYDQSQGSHNNLNENNHIHRESARALGEAIVASCPDAAAVERRLGQIREYIRVTSSLVDTMRNSEDEAFIEHTKEEYDELVDMVMKLKESETSLEKMLVVKEPDNIEVPGGETVIVSNPSEETEADAVVANQNKVFNAPESNLPSTTLKKVTNEENEQINKILHNAKSDEIQPAQDVSKNIEVLKARSCTPDHLEKIEESSEDAERQVEIQEIESTPYPETEVKKDDDHLNAILRKNILSCVEKVALIEEMKNKNKDSGPIDEVSQDVVVRPVSAQSNGSAYSDNELWQNEIKNKMELSQMRLAALKQQQKRLLKYQEEAKQQLDELHRERQSQENIQPSTSHENFSSMQNPSFSGNYHNARMYAANQIGVATTLPHSTEHQSIANNIENERNHSAHSTHSHDDRFSHHVNVASSEEAGGGTRESDNEEDEALLTDRGRDLQMKLRELQLKKQHMENLVSEFQKLQMVTRLPSSHNTYSSSGEESADEGPSRKCNKSSGNMKNEDPFKLMEIKAIKTALQKTKDLMRSVENYEVEQGLSGSHDDPFQIPSHSNIHDNKSEGGGSMGGWSNDGSLCRVRNSLPQRHKFTNEQHSQQTQQHSQQSQHIQQSQQQMQQLQQHVQQLQQHVQNQQQHAQNQQQHVQNPQIHAQQHPHQQQNHEANLASLQELAQELRMETEKIMNERARIKDMVSNKEIARKQKKVNEEVRPSTNGQAGPAERRQQQLRALLADKQRELQALLHKEKVLCSSSEVQNPKPDSRTASVVNQSYTSEQEPDSRSEQILMDSQTSRENENFRTSGDSALGARSINTLPSHLGSNYDSDSDSASRNNQRNRARRRQERISNDNNVLLTQSNNSNQNLRHEPRPESSNVNLVPPIAQSSDTPTPMQYPHVPPPWNTSKSNQDMRTNQFTQNSHSQTMERLLGTPQMSFPPSMPYNMMLPYAGMLGGGCACGCGVWGAWCWQQVALQQREIHQLRDQLNHLEERWRAENASHMLNNQVPPGNRANNYWDNFRSYSRQNLLSANSKTNADSQPSTSAGPPPAPAAPAPPAAFRHITNPIPDPPHACNLNKRKSSTKLPAKNSRRNAPDRANLNLAAPNPNLASTSRDLHDKATSKLFDLLRENVYSEVTALIGVNESHPDFLIQLFRELQHISSDPLRQRVLQSIRGVLTQYGTTAEVQADIQVDESAPDEVTTTSVEPGPYQHGPLSIQNACAVQVDNKIVRFLLMRSEEVFTAESLEDLAALILNTADGRQSQQSRKQLLEMLAKYEGMRVCDASNDIVENLPLLTSGNNEGDESTQHTELTENSMLQDVAGSLNLFSASDTQLHQISCPYDMWPGHVHMDIEEEIGDSRPHSSQEGKVDLINCSEMQNGELAEADQTCREEGGGAGPAAGAGELPDVVDADEATPTEAEAEWLGLDRVPTRLHMEKSSGNQKD